ncbi:Zinc finger protein basonuclin-2 [Trichuris trichiura]|uniref:Zinc finger protein basonuclin-2 n=1 Tax=Trichuris trichiura TaxID=36087 RepID=A0A077ZD26_TRITR|nr:Zinc finger protein basonuclin-2 [Trichuris trichiura]
MQAMPIAAMSKNVTAYPALVATCNPLSSSSSSSSSSSTSLSSSTSSSSSPSSTSSSPSSSNQQVANFGRSKVCVVKLGAMILKCVGLACDCPNFQASASNARCCDRCHHSWLSHGK